jgi:hypothetical protein
MKILDKIFIKNLAKQLVFVELDGPEPALGSTVYRQKNGRDDDETWIVRGVEWYAIPRRPDKGDKVGLLLEGPPIYVLESIKIDRPSK